MKKCSYGFKRIVGLITLLVIGMSAPVWAKSPINTNWNGVAIKGYDTVAYFTDGNAVKGKKQFEYRWKDATWRFSNDRHLEMFKVDPEKYAPRYGGY